MSILSKEDLQKLTSEKITKKIKIKDIGEIEVKALGTEERAKLLEISFNIQTGKIDVQKFENYVLLSCIEKPRITIDDMEWLNRLPAGTVIKILNEIYSLSDLL